MEKFKSVYSGCEFVREDNGRCYLLDDAMRQGEYIGKKAKYRISQRDYEYHKALNERRLAGLSA